MVRIRAKTSLEPIKNSDRKAIIIHELPYVVNKAKLIERIAEQVKDKKIEGIQDLRDESDRTGMRVVIELKRGESDETVLANLFKHSALQSSFGITLLAVVDGQPRILSLIQILKHFLNHRIDVVVRRTQFELKKAQERAHILQGLKIALDNSDEVVSLIRSSSGGKEAKSRLMDTFSLSAIQAQAILDMRLQRLTVLEFDKLVSELKELLRKIASYQQVLGNEDLVLDIIKKELAEIRDTYATVRKTEIMDYDGEIDQEDLIPVEEMAVTMSRNGYIKRCAVDIYQSQNRGGKGKIGMSTVEEDILERIFVASTHDTLLIFSNLGKIHWKKVYQLPLASRTARGRAWINILPLEENEKVVYCTPISEYSENTYAIMLTEKGIIKKTALTAYSNQRAKGTKAIVIDEDDNLTAVRIAKDNDMVFIATECGIALKLPAGSLRPQGRVTRGCRGIRFKSGIDDRVISMEIIEDEGHILTVTENGYGKKTDPADYRLGSRGNMGVMNIKNSKRNGKVVGSIMVNETDEIILITQKGKVIRLRVNQVRMTGRVTQGVRLINLEQDEKVVSIAKIVVEEEGDIGGEKVVDPMEISDETQGTTSNSDY